MDDSLSTWGRPALPNKRLGNGPASDQIIITHNLKTRGSSSSPCGSLHRLMLNVFSSSCSPPGHAGTSETLAEDLPLFPDVYGHVITTSISFSILDIGKVSQSTIQIRAEALRGRVNARAMR